MTLLWSKGLNNSVTMVCPPIRGDSLNRKKSRPNSRIKPRMYVMRSIMKEKAAFCKVELRKISSVACGFSSITIHYFVNRITEVYVFQ